MSVHNDFPESALTPWFPRTIKPVRVGIYRTSREDIKDLGSSYGWWDGSKWQPLLLGGQTWGAYHQCENMIWRGLNHQRRIPLEGGTLET